VTRIIAGFAGSLSLGVPPTGTRPTADRVREAIFSALDARDAVAGARVLDLFAGSGALGLEAASRGAVEVTLVDRVKAAADLCRRNAALVLGRAPAAAKPRITVSMQPVQAYLAAAVGELDLVFLDPPYDDAVEEALTALVPHLAADAVVVLERSARTPPPVLPEGLELDRRKDYGDTAVYWLAPIAD
jgi:16S rRNA (guanine966-N2)-methyltransferase